MELKAKKPFSWAHQGSRIEEYEAGQFIETEDADLIAVATAEGWAERADKPAANKAKKAAPETK
jgi:hypothetical protein